MSSHQNSGGGGWIVSVVIMFLVWLGYSFQAMLNKERQPAIIQSESTYRFNIPRLNVIPQPTTDNTINSILNAPNPYANSVLSPPHSPQPNRATCVTGRDYYGNIVTECESN